MKTGLFYQLIGHKLIKPRTWEIIESIKNHPEEWGQGSHGIRHVKSGLDIWTSSGSHWIRGERGGAAVVWFNWYERGILHELIQNFRVKQGFCPASEPASKKEA